VCVKKARIWGDHDRYSFEHDYQDRVGYPVGFFETSRGHVAYVVVVPERVVVTLQPLGCLADATPLLETPAALGATYLDPPA
jgi:hypothetical protein